jgi:hypothetical protein
MEVRSAVQPFLQASLQPLGGELPGKEIRVVLKEAVVCSNGMRWVT